VRGVCLAAYGCPDGWNAGGWEVMGFRSSCVRVSGEHGCERCVECVGERVGVWVEVGSVALMCEGRSRTVLRLWVGCAATWTGGVGRGVGVEGGGGGCSGGRWGVSLAGGKWRAGGSLLDGGERGGVFVVEAGGGPGGSGMGVPTGCGVRIGGGRRGWERAGFLRRRRVPLTAASSQHAGGSGCGRGGIE